MENVRQHSPQTEKKQLVLSKVLFVVCALILAATSAFGMAVPEVDAATGINRAVNYQGKLMDSSGNPVTDGTYQIKFRLYSQTSGGFQLWSASTTNGLPTGTPAAVSVQIKNGLFSLLLGDVAAGQVAFPENFFNNDTLYLGVTVGADSEMAPRKRLSAVPYAFNSETLQGQYASHTVANTGGDLFGLRQASSDAANATRTALYVETKGTSNVYDYLMRLSNGAADVFNVNRQGDVYVGGTLNVVGKTTLSNASATNATLSNNLYVLGTASTSRLLFVNATGTNLAVLGYVNSNLLPRIDNNYVLGNASYRWKGVYAVSVTSTNVSATTVNAGTVSTTNLIVNGQSVTTSVPTWQQVTDQGATTNRRVQFAGATSTSNVKIQGLLDTDMALFINATGTNLALLGRVNSSLLPMTTDSYSLGSATYRWLGLVVKNATTTNIYASGYVSSSAIYINGRSVTTSVPTLQQVTIKGATTDKWINFAGATSSGNLVPSSNNLYALGSSAYRWSDVWSYNTHVGATSSWDLAKSANEAFTISRAGSERMRISTNGYVGIGTSNPLGPIHVSSTSAGIMARNVLGVGGVQAAMQIGIMGNPATAGSGPSYLFFASDSAGQKEFLGRLNAIWENATNGAEASGLSFTVRANAGDTTAATEVMRITSSGNVGIGTTLPTSKLTVNGRVSIQGAPDKSLANWSNTNLSAVGIESVRSLYAYNGYLYAGQGDNAGDGDVKVCNPAGGGNANDCDNAADWSTSLDNAAATRVNTITAFRGRLYEGEGNGAGLGIVRYCRPEQNGTATLCDAADWATANFPAGPQQIRQLVVYNGYLYAANDTGVAGGASVGVCNPAGGGNANDCDNAADWTNIALQGGTTYEEVPTLVVYLNRLYALTGSSNADDDVFACTPSVAGDPERCDNANDWTRVLNNAGGGYVYESFESSSVYNGYLYTGKGKGATDGDVVRCEPQAAGDDTLCDNTADFTTVVNNGGTITRVPSMTVYDGALFFGYEGATGDGDIVEYRESFTTSTANGAGFEATYAFATFNGRLYAGRGNATGHGQVWSYQKARTASYDLLMQAGSSTGSMWFSNESYNYQGEGTPYEYQIGAFNFSHGIVTDAGAYDLAEQYPTQDASLRAGDVVALDEFNPGFIRKSNGANDKNVLGVVSTKAGFTLSGPKDGDSRPVALVGRVPVKISSENGDVAVGDPLTSASLPGHAMKATQPGMIIGHALESFSSSTSDLRPPTSDAPTGTIMMVVQTGYYFGDNSTPVGQLAAYLGQSTTTQVIQQAFQGDAYAIQQVAGGLVNPQVADGSALSGVDAANVGTLIVRTAALVAGDLTVGGTTRLMGHVVVSDDTAGVVDLKPGEQYVEVKFVKPYDAVPVVVVTPESDAQEYFQPWMGRFRVGNKTINGFRIYVDEGACVDPTNCGRTMKFNWMAVGLQSQTAATGTVPLIGAAPTTTPSVETATTTESGTSGNAEPATVEAPAVTPSETPTTTSVAPETTVEQPLDGSGVTPTSTEPITEPVTDTNMSTQTDTTAMPEITTTTTEGGGAP